MHMLRNKIHDTEALVRVLVMRGWRLVISAGAADDPRVGWVG